MAAGGILVGSAYGQLGLDLSPLKQGFTEARGLLAQLRADTSKPIVYTVQAQVNTASITSAAASIQQLAQAQAASTGAATTYGSRIAQLGQQFPGFTSQSQSVVDALRAQSTGLQATGDESEKVKTKQRNLFDVGIVAAGNLLAGTITKVTSALIGYGREAVQAFASNERLGLSLQSLVAREEVTSGRAKDVASAFAGAAPKAQELLKWTQQLAIDSPFSQDGVAAAFRQAQAYGFVADSADKSVVSAKRLTTALINFASGSGGTEDTMQRIALALGQVQAKGKLAGGEMLQLTDAGLNVRAILADAFKVPTEEVVRLQERGLIPANKAIKAIVESLERDFGNAAKAQANTISGLLNSLDDLKTITLRETFAGLITAAKPFLVDIVGRLTDPAVQQQLRDFGAGVGQAFVQAIPGLVSGAKALYGVFQTLQPLISLVGNLFGSNLGPILVGFAATKLTPVITGIISLSSNLSGLSSQIAAAGGGLKGGLAVAFDSAAAKANLLATAIFLVVAAYQKYRDVQAQISQGNKDVEQKVIGGAKSYEDFEARRARAQQIAANSSILGISLDKLGVGVVEDLTQAQYDYVKALEARGVSEEEAIQRARTGAKAYELLQQATVGGTIQTRDAVGANITVQAQKLSPEGAKEAEKTIGAVLDKAPSAARGIAQMTEAFASGKLSQDGYLEGLRAMLRSLEQQAQITANAAEIEALEAQRLSRRTSIMGQAEQSTQAVKDATSAYGQELQKLQQQRDSGNIKKAVEDAAKAFAAAKNSASDMARQLGITQAEAEKRILEKIIDALHTKIGATIPDAQKLFDLVTATQAQQNQQDAQTLFRAGERGEGNFGSIGAYKAHSKGIQDAREHTIAFNNAQKDFNFQMANTAQQIKIVQGELAGLSADDPARFAKQLQLNGLREQLKNQQQQAADRAKAAADRAEQEALRNMTQEQRDILQLEDDRVKLKQLQIRLEQIHNTESKAYKDTLAQIKGVQEEINDLQEKGRQAQLSAGENLISEARQRRQEERDKAQAERVLQTARIGSEQYLYAQEELQLIAIHQEQRDTQLRNQLRGVQGGTAIIPSLGTALAGTANPFAILPGAIPQPGAPAPLGAGAIPQIPTAAEIAKAANNAVIQVQVVLDGRDVAAAIEDVTAKNINVRLNQSFHRAANAGAGRS